MFQKIFDEIKYLCKVVTAGSKEAKQLLEVKKAFEEAYRTATKNTVVEDGVRYALASNENITPSKEQLLGNAKAVTEMESVCEISADNLLDTGKDIKEIYAEHFSKWGNNIHSDVFGDIAVKRSSIGSEFAHGNTAEKIAAIEAIPSVIEHGKIIDWFEKSKGLFRITVAAPIKIGGTPYYMGVMLQRDSQNQRLYIHDVILEKEASASTQEHLSTKGPYSGNKNLSISSILRKALVVNPQYLEAVQNGDMETAQKMVDEAAQDAGYTVKAYHGSGEKFNTFSYGHIGSATGVGILGDGFYFSDTKPLAKMYGREMYAVRLRMENTYHATESDQYKINTEELIKQGYDSVDMTLPGGGKIYCVFDNTQMKSADPVSYDDKGKVIPLSERFNPEKTDIRYSLSEEAQADDIAPLPWQVRGRDVALEDIAPIGENVVTKQNAASEGELVPVREDAVATTREYISLEDYANNESPVWRNVEYSDEETKAAITQETHDRMVSSGAVVAVAEDVMGEVEKSFPDLRSMKKTERTPILKEAINKLKNNIRQFLTSLSNQNFEFEVNGKVLEAKLYSTGINEVLEKVTQDKANMLYSTEEIFRNAQYLYSTPDYDGDPNVYRWNYFYTPVQIGKNTVGVRIAVRDVVKGVGMTPESQIYNWGIKKDASLDGGRRGPRVASSGVSSDASNNNIPQTPPNVNPDDSTGAAPSGFDPVSHLQYEYGSLPEGENAVREDSLPKSTNGKDRVSLTARTAKGAEATPDELDITCDLEFAVYFWVFVKRTSFVC